jgi:hypothetical protein
VATCGFQFADAVRRAAAAPSDKADFITGQIIGVNGGKTAL